MNKAQHRMAHGLEALGELACREVIVMRSPKSGTADAGPTGGMVAFPIPGKKAGAVRIGNLRFERGKIEGRGSMVNARGAAACLDLEHQ
jgi:hypothetical protein